MIKQTVILGYDGKIPIIEVTQANDYQVCFYCEFCKKIHLHGGNGEDANGHRCAHCHNEFSPFDDKGYILQFKQESKQNA